MSISKRDLIVRLHERGFNPSHELFSQEVRILVFEFLGNERENASEALSNEVEKFVKYFKGETNRYYVACKRNFDPMMIKYAGFFDLEKKFKNFESIDDPNRLDQLQPRPRPQKRQMVRFCSKNNSPQVGIQKVQNSFIIRNIFLIHFVQLFLFLLSIYFSPNF
jgi:hypothetical protein